MLRNFFAGNVTCETHTDMVRLEQNKSSRKETVRRMTIHQSAEDYLETILVLKERHNEVRSIDIATELQYTKASVSIAMKKLRQNGYVEMDANGFITLTDAGQEIASQIYSRHKCLTSFFIQLGVDPEVAAADACRVEHDLSDETFEKLLEHVKQHTRNAE